MVLARVDLAMADRIRWVPACIRDETVNHGELRFISQSRGIPSEEDGIDNRC